MPFNPQALNERTLKQFVDRLSAIRQSQPVPDMADWPPKRSAIQEEVAKTLGFTSWHHAIHAVRPSTSLKDMPTPPPAAVTYPLEPIRWKGSDIDTLLDWAVTQNASDIVLQSEEVVFLEVFGRNIRTTRRNLSNEEVMDMIEKIYGSDSVRGHLLDRGVDFAYVTPAKNRFTVNAVSIVHGGAKGVQVGFRSIPTMPPVLSDVFPDMPECLRREVFRRGGGIVAVAGQTSSGKSTTISAMIRELISVYEDRKVVTYEAPVEFDFQQVPRSASCSFSQTDISGMRMSFSESVLNATRRKATDIVLELRDKETLSECISAAQSGHRLWCSIHAYGVADVLRRMVRVFEQQEHNLRYFDIVSSLSAVISQRLLPTVDGRRVAAREVLVFDDEVKESLLDVGPENITPEVFKLLASRKSDFLSDAFRLHGRGVISDKTLSQAEQSHRAERLRG